MSKIINVTSFLIEINCNRLKCHRLSPILLEIICNRLKWHRLSPILLEIICNRLKCHRLSPILLEIICNRLKCHRLSPIWLGIIFNQWTEHLTFRFCTVGSEVNIRWKIESVLLQDSNNATYTSCYVLFNGVKNFVTKLKQSENSAN